MKILENLKWQVEMGADEAYSDTPINRLKAPQKPEEPEKKHIVQASEVTIATQKNSSAPDLLAKTRALAEKANTLEELKEAVCSFKDLAICKTATNTVFSDGNPKAKIMLIGEAPGANEDLEGIPFCGASGKLLDNMIKSIGLSRAENAYISNTLFWRPPGNRRPTPEELEICRPFLEKHVALIDPDLLIMVGGTAAAAMVDDKTPVSKLRGKIHSYKTPYKSKDYKVVVTFHPSYLLRSPQQKRLAWQDMLFIQKTLEN